MPREELGDGITHYCQSGDTKELEQGRYLPDAQEYRSYCDECGPVYHNGEITHE